eukprot:COSAG03_NODE_28583_length_196_cov_74.360825_1_plen_26_part_01
MRPCVKMGGALSDWPAVSAATAAHTK